jgi:CRISPR/Cas system CSM-associated protein Csm5 (group 7 of RAMP superfamily)
MTDTDLIRLIHNMEDFICHELAERIEKLSKKKNPDDMDILLGFSIGQISATLLGRLLGCRQMSPRRWRVWKNSVRESQETTRKLFESELSKNLAMIKKKGSRRSPRKGHPPQNGDSHSLP